MVGFGDKTKIIVSRNDLHPSPELGAQTIDDVLIVLTQAFCQNGHNLIENSTVCFEGQPGISLKVSNGQYCDIVVCSPIHSDSRKAHSIIFPIGTKLCISCPVCNVPLKALIPCTCGNGELINLYLSKNLSEGQVAAVCNVWGCPRSRIIDNFQIISQFVEGSEC